MRGGFERCPGCGDLGDLVHVASCSRARLSRSMHEGAELGAELVLRMVTKQLQRRGRVDVDALRSAIDSAKLPPTGRGWFRFLAATRDLHTRFRFLAATRDLHTRLGKDGAR